MGKIHNVVPTGCPFHSLHWFSLTSLDPTVLLSLLSFYILFWFNLKLLLSSYLTFPSLFRIHFFRKSVFHNFFYLLSFFAYIIPYSVLFRFFLYIFSQFVSCLCNEALPFSRLSVLVLVHDSSSDRFKWRSDPPSRSFDLIRSILFFAVDRITRKWFVRLMIRLSSQKNERRNATRCRQATTKERHTQEHENHFQPARGYPTTVVFMDKRNR